MYFKFSLKMLDFVYDICHLKTKLGDIYPQLDE